MLRLHQEKNNSLELREGRKRKKKKKELLFWNSLRKNKRLETQKQWR
jgi:hypothetical protein